MFRASCAAARYARRSARWPKRVTWADSFWTDVRPSAALSLSWLLELPPLAPALRSSPSSSSPRRPLRATCSQPRWVVDVSVPWSVVSARASMRSVVALSRVRAASASLLAAFSERSRSLSRPTTHCSHSCALSISARSWTPIFAAAMFVADWRPMVSVAKDHLAPICTIAGATSRAAFASFFLASQRSGSSRQKLLKRGSSRSSTWPSMRVKNVCVVRRSVSASSFVYGASPVATESRELA
mmetsp:Transcript_28003/g.90292  ORF Transcript_28003/g.90292 Transcript_28003/m.90292 type:complete len:242 (+) Transcript_28003:579-1304(+)